MKKLSLIFSIICLIFINNLIVFAASNSGFEELTQKMSGDKFTGQIYKSASTINYTDSSKWVKMDDNKDYDNDMLDEFDYFITTNASSTKPVWIEYGKNEWYLVTKTEKVSYTYEDSKGDIKEKTESGVYAITEIFDDDICIVNGKAYFFEEGVCANNGSAISSDKGLITFDSSGKATKNYEIEIDIKECNLDVYESDDFDGTKGVLDKDSNKKLYNGYWILDKGNDKYDLYNANSSGSSSTVSGATNKSAYELYTIIKNKNYTQKASTSSNNNTTTNTLNNTTNTNKSNNTINANTNTTSNKDITKNVTKTTKKISTNLNSNDYSFKVVNGSVQLILNNGYKFLDAGTYYYDGFLITIDSNGKETSIEESDPGNYKDITNSSLQTIKIDGNKYRIIK